MSDTLDKVEEYLESLEEYFFSSLAAATTDLPNIHEAVNRLWIDIARYGPGMPSFPEMHLPALGDFQVPPPPPPPPPPVHISLLEKSTNLAKRHPWVISSVAVGVVGAGLLVGYSRFNARKRCHQKDYKAKAQSTERRQVVVVLGADSPLALPLIIDLEAKGYIVIASVSTPEAIATLEQACNGYVRALVLDPHEPATIPVFLRSLASTLSRRFPITASGDPFVSPSSHPYIQSVVCLLTLPTSIPSIHAPLEHISLRNTYLPFLSATHITPLQVLQALMPLLRTGPARARDKGKKTIIVCLPAIEARVGLPFAAMQAMGAASTLRGVEVLRREINLAALTDKSESMKNIKVVVADVGVLDAGGHQNAQPDSIYRAMEEWTPSEKLTYGPAFASISQAAPPPETRLDMCLAIVRNRHRCGVARTPTDINAFVHSIVSVVSGGRHDTYHFAFGRTIGQIKNWLRGERFSIGAGDALLNIPHFLISIRNRLLPIEPFVRPPPLTSTSSQPTAATTATENSHQNSESENEAYENSSEADVESNASDGIGSSWISLQTRAKEHDESSSEVPPQ
ncbi:hypothetical protein DXG03_007170 [Asterophora parasitica]|uniref:DUF1776-domain-containing protein n=1 Tax=Asterophora parasitica TaxID=117018 RepID=A0A9P7G972_9AGAR|nr:hypothetical protein DXG03_007170 [Asterophora parasitica]